MELLSIKKKKNDNENVVTNHSGTPENLPSFNSSQNMNI